jgi:mRNA interferase RelE/StbE
MYQIRILDAATRDLTRLDASVARRIVNRVRWLSENVNEIKPEALKGDLAGFYRMRVGDYRAVYEILHSEQAIIIHLVGHRRDIYRNL